MTRLLSFCLFLALGQAVFSQNPLNMTLLGHWDDDTLPTVSPNNLRFAFSGCWGTVANGREIAIVGGARAIFFFDVTEPTRPELIGKFYGSVTALHEVKTYKDRVYTTAGSGNEGLMIFDLSHVPDTIVRTYWSNEFFNYSHTLTLDTASARLYLNGSDIANDGVLVLDLSQNPDKPVVLAKHSLPGGYVHDAYVRNDTFYVSSGFEGFYVFDFQDVQAPKLLANVSTGGYNHYSGLTPNGEFAYYAEEIPAGRPVQIVDLRRLPQNEIEIAGSFLDNMVPGGDPKGIPHNLFIKGNLLYVSQYEDGLLVYDIGKPLMPKLIGWYDTHPENAQYNGYFGNWGNYPWLPSGTIITVDMQNGLFLLRLDASTAAEEPSNEIPLVWPNPARDLWHVRLSDQTKVRSYRISDAQGRVLAAQSGDWPETFDISAHDLPNGLFVLEVWNEAGRRMFKKIIKY